LDGPLTSGGARWYINPMNLHPVDLAIIVVYLLGVVMIGFVVRKRATKKLDSFYLADRNVPWWMLGLSGCSSYIDIGGTMSMIGLIFYLGLKPSTSGGPG
jgi:SSS family solute:Na+ symporter